MLTVTTWVRSLPPELAPRGTGVRGLRHTRLIHERAWFDSRVPHSMRGRLTAGRLALTQVIGVRNPASQPSRHHRLTDRPPGSQSGDRSSNLRGAITLGMWRSWQRARFGTARPHVRIVPSRLSESKPQDPPPMCFWQHARFVPEKIRFDSVRRLWCHPEGIPSRAATELLEEGPDSHARATAHQTAPGEHPGRRAGGAARTCLATATNDRPGRMAADAAGETGYRQRASNPKRPVSRRPAGRGHRWMMGRASAPTESGLSPAG